MRLVDADAFAMYLQLVCKGNDMSAEKKVFSANGIIHMLQDMPTALDVKWTPVTEKLPEKKKASYWVCTDTGYQCQCRWTDDVYGLGSNGEWAWKIFDIPQYSHVVAWMPLPEPYEVKDED